MQKGRVSMPEELSIEAPRTKSKGWVLREVAARTTSGGTGSHPHSMLPPAMVSGENCKIPHRVRVRGPA